MKGVSGVHITDNGTTRAETSGLERGHECHGQRKPSIASNSVKSIDDLGGFSGFSSLVDET